MQNRLPENDSSPRSLAARFDHAAGNINAFLVVLAIGLATLDLTCFWAFKMRDALPAMALAATSSTAAVNKPVNMKAETSLPRGAKSGW